MYVYADVYADVYAYADANAYYMRMRMQGGSLISPCLHTGTPSGPLTLLTIEEGTLNGAFRHVLHTRVVWGCDLTSKLDADMPDLDLCAPTPLLFRYSDGEFVEFEERREYVLHEKDYHGLVTVNRNLSTMQRTTPASTQHRRMCD